MAEPQVFAGAEPFLVENGNIGVLVSHGFTGNPHSMRYLAEGLASAGFTVALPRLKGHGTTPADMAASTASDWVADLERASAWLQQRCDTLFMTGLSMGGTLTLLMAGQHPDLFKGIIPINAMLFSNNPDLASLAFMSPATAEVSGIGSDIKAVGVTDNAYPVITVPTINELFTFTNVADEILQRICYIALNFALRNVHIVTP